jgi:hypothetical protein
MQGKVNLMSSRRSFLKIAAAATVGSAASMQAADSAKAGAVFAGTGTADRTYWCQQAIRLARPVLEALSRRRLKAEMPVEAQPGFANRANYTHLEALGRLLVGLAPWLELGGDQSAEGRVRAHYAELARQGIDAATDPASPDLMNFSKGGQPLVDAAFLAQGVLRAPKELWAKLEPRVQKNVVAAMKSSRPIKPGESNWKLFATTVEVLLQKAGEPRDDARLFQGLTRHRDWYVGDGTYGDGPKFHWDYYNSFVIQPMLVEALDVVVDEAPEWAQLRDQARARLTRWPSISIRTS